MSVTNKPPKLTRRNRAGASLVETVVGLMFLIPIVLAIVDVTAVVVAQTQNDTLAKHACREAATVDPNNPPTPLPFSPYTPAQAATIVVNNFKTHGQSQLCNNPTMDLCTPNFSSGLVYVQTSVKCNLPVAFPFIQNPVALHSDDTEPIVAVLAPASTGG